MVKYNRKPNSFNLSFLYDFDLGDAHKQLFKKTIKIFHNPIVKSCNGGGEGLKHFSLKKNIAHHIYFNYYLQDKKFYVTTELEQKYNPFISYMNNREIFFTLDICVLRMKDAQVFDIEIDGKEHQSAIGMMKARYRDAVLEDRYKIKTMRIDSEEKEPPYKEIIEFLNS